MVPVARSARPQTGMLECRLPHMHSCCRPPCKTRLLLYDMDRTGQDRPGPDRTGQGRTRQDSIHHLYILKAPKPKADGCWMMMLMVLLLLLMMMMVMMRMMMMMMMVMMMGGKVPQFYIYKLPIDRLRGCL